MNRSDSVKVEVSATRGEMGRRAARAGAAYIRRALEERGRAFIIVATGASQFEMLEALVKQPDVRWDRVTGFHLDEYVGLPITHEQSYHRFMQENFFRHVNIPAQNIHIPSGTTTNYRAFCDWYEKRIVECGGIDLQIVGIGSDGHIAFNEPGSSLSSRTRLKTLAKQTIDDNARFFDRPEDVPIYAITMGVGTIMEARQILMLANGAKKAAWEGGKRPNRRTP